MVQSAVEGTAGGALRDDHGLAADGWQDARKQSRHMSVVSILVPFVVAYIGYCWYKMDHKKLTSDELDNTDHKY